jgi:hypothetical protein
LAWDVAAAIALVVGLVILIANVGGNIDIDP